MPIQTYGGLTAENKTFYERTLLERLLPDLVYQKFGQKKTAPKREGDTINFRRFENLTPNTTPLQEGVTPIANNLTITPLNATVAQYGDWIELSDKLDMVGIDPVLTETADLLGESASKVIDTIIRDVVVAGTNVQYAGGKVSKSAISATDKITGEEIKKAVKTLKNANAKRINGYYIGIIDPSVSYDIQSDPLWQDVSKYNGGQEIMKGEIGKIHGVRFIETTNTKVEDNGTVNVHSTMIIGKDAYGVCDIEGSSKPKMIIKDFGSAGTADPLDQRATAGYKLMMTAIRLQELAMIRIESAVTE